jgi:signal transduction histidine kinase
VSAGGDWAKVVIRDQGIGIPAKDLPHVFEPFRRGANVDGRIRGTGIGLANAQHIVEQHGGAISVESAPGKGSTFIVRLPLQPARV